MTVQERFLKVIHNQIFNRIFRVSILLWGGIAIFVLLPLIATKFFSQSLFWGMILIGVGVVVGLGLIVLGVIKNATLLSKQEQANSRAKEISAYTRVKHFSHSNSVLLPVQKFFIDGRWLYLYHCKGRTPSTVFSLYWGNELNPVQHAMNDLEVFAVLADLINPKEKK